jgi:hypothetical protein
MHTLTRYQCMLNKNPKLINPLALSPAYAFRQNLILHIFFSSISMKPNDVSLLLSHSLNSHREHHLSRKQFKNQKPEIEIMESRKILFKPTSVRWNPQNYLTTRDTCILTTILCAHHSSFNFTYFIFQTTHYNLLISSTNVTSSRKTLNNMTRHFS